MLTRTSEYALRAMIHLAQCEEEWPVPGREIASRAGVPAKYLSKILRDLVRARVLESAPGKSGGFRMQLAPAKTTLLQVLSPFEQFEYRRCPFGNQQCSNENPCIAHEQWKKVIETQQRFLKRMTVAEISARATRKRKKRRKSRSR